MKILEQIFLERNLKKSTQETYTLPAKEYEKLHKKSLEDLIEEADTEEEERIRLKNRKIKKRLLKYRQYLINKKLTPLTIKNRITRIRTIYHHFEIELPRLPPVQLQDKDFVRFSDIPTIDHIKQVLNSTANKKHKALILFMSSSGTAVNETVNLKIKDFIKATKQYHDNTDDIDEILIQLNKQEDVIPLFEMVRLKTNYPYYTCCSSEATKAIVEYLRFEDDLTLERELFNYNKGSISNMFKRYNEKMGWDKVRKYSFFRPHALRKFHATTIEEVGLANTLQGRKADPITEAYFKKNPKRIKEEYMKHLEKLSINKVKVNVLNDKGMKELKKVKNELAETKKKHKEEVNKLKMNVKKEVMDELKKELMDELRKELVEG